MLNKQRVYLLEQPLMSKVTLQQVCVQSALTQARPTIVYRSVYYTLFEVGADPDLRCLMCQVTAVVRPGPQSFIALSMIRCSKSALIQISVV